MFTLADRAAGSTVTFKPSANVTRYFTAAAGAVKVKAAAGDPSTESPATYNGLTAWASNPGEVTAKFDGPSGGALQYIVKVLPQATADAIFGDPTVAFGAFLAPDASGAQRFTLLVKNAGAAVSAINLKDKTLMIEVSALGTG
jgi:hypothetical protein